MAREIEKLIPAGVRKLKRKGFTATAQVSHQHVGPDAGEKAGKSWIFRFMLNGRAREMGLGSATYDFASVRARELAH